MLFYVFFLKEVQSLVQPALQELIPIRAQIPLSLLQTNEPPEFPFHSTEKEKTWKYSQVKNILVGPQTIALISKREVVET